MPAPTWAISGAAGRLLCGSRVAATFADWSATPLEDGRWRIACGSMTPDPYWFENGTGFRAALVVGRGDVRGLAQLVSREPLVFDMEI